MLSDSVAIAMLASLESMGPRRLHHLLGGARPSQRVADLRDGAKLSAALAGAPVKKWRGQIGQIDSARVAHQLDAADMVVSMHGEPEHRHLIGTDIDPAPVLFRRGVEPAPGPRVAIIGTRRATGVGREVARELGFGLAAEGVCVVSGLALGIDGAAHEGALAAEGAPPLAFVGGGVDVVYPQRHARLWEQVIAAGTVVSEAPPGAPPTRWRFPARNRLIAAASDIVVVVESRGHGGSMLTVNEAIRRDRTVMAVPGSVRNTAAEGTNSLIVDGCAPVTGVDDVLIALGLQRASAPSRQRELRPDSKAAESSGQPISEAATLVLTAIDDGGTSLDSVVSRVGLGAAAVLAAVGELCGAGVVVDDGSRIRRV